MEVSSIITVRTLSTRLPEKCLMKFGECNVLQYVIRRAIKSNLKPIVCTTIDSSDNIVQKIANEENVPVFRGSIKNKMKRWLDCCEKYNIEYFHTIDADDPFFDSIQIMDSYELLFEGYDIVYPTKTSRMGGASVGFSIRRDALYRACANLGDDIDTEMMWHYLESTPSINKIDLPDKYNDIKNVRLTLDYIEDYWLLDTVRRILGEDTSRQRINSLFLNNRDLHLINWFRNVEWKQKQESKNPYK